MHMRVVLAISLLSGALQAAEPASTAAKPATKPAAAAAATAAAASANTANTRTTAARSATTNPPPLNLRIGDVRKYMMPNDYRAAISAPDAERDTVIVEADRPAPLLESEKPQPVGFGAVYSLFRHPTTAWRLFLPDTSAYAAAAGPPDVVPQKEFRWGP